jgi:hypothetical protein
VKRGRPARGRSKPRSQLDGYASEFERKVAADLTERGVSFDYEEEQLLYEIPCAYTTDFTLPNGVIVEAKGYMDADERRKLRELKRAHPDRDIRLLFQRASNRISRAVRSLTYGQWATRAGYLWAEGRIPDTWLA